MSTTGIYGLSGSGIDVESMVRVGMMSRQNQYDKMYQKEIKQEWEKEKFTNVYSEMATYSMSTLTQYKLQSNMNAMAASTTNSSAMSVSANGAAVAMSHKIQINSLSSNAYLITTEDGISRASSDNKSSDSINLSDIAFKSIKANASDSSKYDVTDANGNTTTVNASDKAISFRLSDGTTSLSKEDSTVYFTYDDLANGVTLNDLASQINKLGTHVRASYDSVNDAFSIYNSEGGAENNIAISIEAQPVKTEATSATIQSTKAITAYNSGALSDGQVFLDELVSSEKALKVSGDLYNLVEGTTDTFKRDGVTLTKDDEGYTRSVNDDISKLTITTNEAGVSVATYSGNNYNPFTYDSATNSYVDSAGKCSIKLNDDGTTFTYSVKNWQPSAITEGYVYDDDGNSSTAKVFIEASNVNTTDPSSVTANNDTLVKDILGKGESLTGGLSFSINVGSGEEKISYTEDELGSLKMGTLVEELRSKGAVVTFENGRLSLSDNDKGSTSQMMIYGYDDNSVAAKLLDPTVNGKFNLDNVAVYGKDTVYESANTSANTTALFNNLHLGESSNGELSAAKTYIAGNDENNTTKGSNGEVIIDGKKYSDSITNNRLTVGGVTYTLLNKTDSAETVTVTQDTQSIIDRVKGFVEDYNKMLDYFHDLYTEQRYNDYKPLTKTQENAMTKEQVEKWNEKAKSGLLYHNSIVGDIISKMREALSTPVEGATGRYNSAFSLGISVTKTYGYIELDEAKLKTALEAEPDSVYQVFGKLDDADDDFEEIGVAQRLGDVMTDAMKKIRDYAGTSTSVDDDSTLGNSIRNWQTRMSNFQIQLNAYETKLFAKYDLMEQMIQRMGMQMNYLGFNNNY